MSDCISSESAVGLQMKINKKKRGYNDKGKTNKEHVKHHQNTLISSEVAVFLTRTKN